MTLRGFDPEVKTSTGSENIFNSFNQSSVTVADHRLSVSFLKHFTVTMAEGMLVYGQGVLGDVRILNPFMFMHDYYSFFSASSNNYMGFEVGVTLNGGFEINVQANFDQLLLAKEKEDPLSVPTTMGILANVSWTGMVKDSVLNIWLEGVMTTPFMYQKISYTDTQLEKYGYDPTTAPKYFQTDLYVGHRRAFDFSEMAPLGWYYGPDSIAIACGLNINTSKLDLSFDAMYRRHGERNAWDEVKKTGTQWNNTVNYVSPGKAVEHNITVGMDIKYEVMKDFEIMASASVLEVLNYKNNPGEHFESLQATFGAKIALGKAFVMNFLKK